ncbi:hypothetical protein SAMN05192558_108299 [Actinokineospora alba]|uniref:4-amino-4-deoxy-L-arabinose transferase n=1 Tax=Actinokineospora alba TaxID=504798 RepID=A0A1H0S625_9PSEU|nr:hypothetical protein [Actinokineospora alba]TDP66749.1 hypothetical protein C8E96_2262 [Actinokineospora alba]SDI50483.1 hypothetical protein SAMN05421871_105310 [Actinokineospora alba]SDP37213.1 hypothetical protein SAMN05192558_108299 [Actinokineospora alba]
MTTLEHRTGRHKNVRERSLTIPLPSRLGLAAMVIAGVPFGIHLWFLAGGFFVHDDFLITYLAAQGSPLDVGYLFQNYNGHIAPGLFLTAWIVTAVAPLNFAVAMAPLVVAHLAALVVFWRLLVRCFGPRAALLLPFGVVAASPVILASTMWWAYAMQLLPLLLAMFSALYCHVGYLRTGRRRDAILTLVWTVVGMAFFEKAALFVGLLFGVTVLLGPGIARAWLAHRKLWLVHLGLLAVYAVVYFGLATAPVHETEISGAQVVELTRLMVVDTLFTPTLGFPVAGSVFEGSPALAEPVAALKLLGGLAALALVVGGLLVGRGRAGWAWTLLAGYLAVDVVLVALARMPLIGPMIGLDIRYIADAVPVLALCAAFAYLTPLGADGTRPARIPGRSLRVGLVALTAVVLAGATVSTVRLSPNLQFAASRTYVETAGAALRQQPGMVVYDSIVPSNVMIHWFGDQGRTSRVLGLLPDAPRFDEPTAAIFMLDGQGRPQEVKGVVNAVVGKPGPVPECGYPVTDQTTLVPLSGPVKGKRLIRLEYFTSAAGPVTINAGQTSFTLPLQEGVHLLQLVTDAEFDRIDLRRAPGATTACLVGVIIGEPLV